MRFKGVIGFVCAAMLAGCGGGGNSGDKEVLVVTFSYPLLESSAPTLKIPLSVAPAITGLKSFTPHCALLAGALPVGVTLKDNCTISGTPLSSGSFTIQVRLTADNVEGFTDTSSTFFVGDPTPSISVVQGDVYIQDARVNQLLKLDAMVTNLQVAKSGYGDSPTEQIGFTLVGGSLPPGLSMNPVNARLTGTPTARGISSFDLILTLQRGGATYVSAPKTVTLYVASAVTQVSYTGCATAVWAVPWTCSPTIQDLPPGATMRFSMKLVGDLFKVDPVTGVLSGVPDDPGNFSPIVGGLVTLPDGETFETPGLASLATVAPLPNWGSYGVDDGNLIGVVVQPNHDYFGNHTASITVVGNQPFSVTALPPHDGIPGDAYNYVIVANPDRVAPAWVVLDAATGRVSGTAPATAELRNELFEIRMTTTRNGKSATSDLYLWQIMHK